MNGMEPVSRSSVALLRKPGRVNHSKGHTPAPGRVPDRVELSDQARRLGAASQVHTVRREVIQRVRAEINADRYETQEKIDVAIDRMLSSLAAELS